MKKAQVYSVVALLIAIPLFLFITYYLSSSCSGKGVAERIVADQIGHVAKSIENDFYRALDIATKRALLAMISYIVESGSGVDDSVARLRELMINGTIFGNESYIMKNNTLTDWIKKINNKDINFNLNLSYSNLTFSIKYYTLTVSSKFLLNISSKLGNMYLAREKYIPVNVSLLGLEDPSFPLHTEGFVRRYIRSYPFPYTARVIVNGTSAKGSCSGNVTFNQTPDSSKILVTHNASNVSGFLGVIAETTDIPSVECYVIGAANAVQEVNETVSRTGYWRIYVDNTTSMPNAVWHLPILTAIENGYYISGHGPSYLMRMENNMNSSEEGIESFVNVPELELNKIEVKDYSRVDHLYFSNNNTISYGVKGLPQWFKIDEYHASLYNLTILLDK